MTAFLVLVIVVLAAVIAVLARQTVTYRRKADNAFSEGFDTAEYLARMQDNPATGASALHAAFAHGSANADSELRRRASGDAALRDYVNTALAGRSLDAQGHPAADQPEHRSPAGPRHPRARVSVPHRRGNGSESEK